ncbi:MAG: ABC transporter permease [Gemmataceae bacterium]
MRVIWTLAKKELRLLLRDRLAAGLLLGMPLLFILVLGLLLGEGFGQKPDDTLRITIVDLDQGQGLKGKPWSYWVLQDLKETPGIRIETITDGERSPEEEADLLIRTHRRAAILVVKENFSEQINRCSFLVGQDIQGRENINPFHREGVYLDPDDPRNVHRIDLGVRLLKDPMQTSAASIIEQVVQVCMLRVVMPYMIGQAFLRLSEPQFIDKLGEEVRLPVPDDFRDMAKTGKELFENKWITGLGKVALPKEVAAKLGGLEAKLKKLEPLTAKDRVQLAEMIRLASGGNPAKADEFRVSVGKGVQNALEHQFRKFNLTGMTWAALTKSRGDGSQAQLTEFEDREGSGLLRRGAHRYQVLVPAYTVMFSFFLVMTVGWVFVSERRQGTLKRLKAAPITRGQVLLGKLLPCYLISLGQGVFLLVAGRLLFGMRWGPEQWPLLAQAAWLLLVVVSTSLAAMGLALLVAALAKTEVQVALYGAVPVLVLALIGGCVLPREMMPAETQKLSLITPQGWALDAYREAARGVVEVRAEPGHCPGGLRRVGWVRGGLPDAGVGAVAAGVKREAALRGRGPPLEQVAGGGGEEPDRTSSFGGKEEVRVTWPSRSAGRRGSGPPGSIVQSGGRLDGGREKQPPCQSRLLPPHWRRGFAITPLGATVFAVRLHLHLGVSPQKGPGPPADGL